MENPPVAKRQNAASKSAAGRINRSNSIFKAALNHAAAHDERIGNARAREHALASIPDAVGRNVILEEEAICVLLSRETQTKS
jgi:hypothetical protein